MKANLSKKLKLIYLPILLTAVGYCVLYTFLHWLLFIKLHLFSVKEIYINFIIPFTIIWIPILFYLKRRIKLLDIKKKGDRVFGFLFIIWVPIALITMFAQPYIVKATGKLTQLENIYQITNHQSTKYYTLKSYFIDKNNIGVQTAYKVIGKHNENLIMNIYVVMPIFKSQKDTLNSYCLAWLGTNLGTTISNDLDQNEKEKIFTEFYYNSMMKFRNMDFNKFVYLDRVGNSEEGDSFKQAVLKSSKYNGNFNQVFSSVNEPFAERNGNTLTWLVGGFVLSALIWLLMTLIPGFDDKELKLFEKGKPQKDTDLKEFWNSYKPQEGFFITPILIYINIAVFIVMVFVGMGFFSFNGEELVKWGANFRPLTTDGQWWRLLTNTFLHGGLMHLFANMVGFIFVVLFLEPLLGKGRFLIIYLVTGILASCGSIWWYEATVSVGASGAIFGLYGVFLSLLLTKVFPPDFSKVFLISTLFFIGFNLLMGLTGGIDNAAHISGLISGFIIGLIVYPSLKKQDIYE